MTEIVEKLYRGEFLSDSERRDYIVKYESPSTYKGIDNAPYRILVEADFLANIYEDHISMELARNVKNKVFRTESGIKMFEQMYGP